MREKKEDIFRSARELFYTKGYKDTNVSDIAKMTGIGVGTFYNYYPSKEKLFFEVFFKENADMKVRVLRSLNFSEDPVALITNLVTQNAMEMNSNLILKEWSNKELFSSLESNALEHGDPEGFNEFTKNSRRDLINQWKSGGKIRSDLDVEMIEAMFDSLFYIEIHKNDIGIQHFPQLLLLITEFIMKGLTDIPKDK